MPKQKTNRTAYKKVRVSTKGRITRGKAFHSHNTAIKSPKRRRTLSKTVEVDVTNYQAFRGLLPNQVK